MKTKTTNMMFMKDGFVYTRHWYNGEMRVTSTDDKSAKRFIRDKKRISLCWNKDDEPPKVPHGGLVDDDYEPGDKALEMRNRRRSNK